LKALAYEFTGTVDVLFTDAFTLEQRAVALTTYAVRRGRLEELIKRIEDKRGK
jgi:hypothetical protein